MCCALTRLDMLVCFNRRETGGIEIYWSEERLGGTMQEIQKSQQEVDVLLKAVQEQIYDIESR